MKRYKFVLRDFLGRKHGSGKFGRVQVGPTWATVTRVCSLVDFTSKFWDLECLAVRFVISLWQCLFFFFAAADRALGMVGQQSSYTVKEKESNCKRPGY